MTKLWAAVICVVALGVFLVPTSAQEQNEVDYVKSIFATVQALSISQNREYCGYVGYASDGMLTSTSALRGEFDECAPEWPDDFDVVASWHTHGAFDDAAWSEVPSVLDIEADEEEGIDGYVATPGGRLWFVDTTDMVVSQICSLGCLEADPYFPKGAEGDIAQSYTYEELLEREAE